MQQLLGVAQQEAIGFVVEMANLLLDAAQQTQLTEVTQGEVCRLIETPLARTLIDGSAYQRHQGRLCHHVDVFANRTVFLIPLAGIIATVAGSFAYHVFIHLTVAKLEEKSCHATLAVLEVIDTKTL